MKLSKILYGIITVSVLMLEMACTGPDFYIKNVGKEEQEPDTVQPWSPTNYSAICMNNTITVNWTDSSNSDLYAIGLYYTATGSSTITSKEILVTPSSFSDRHNSYVIEGDFKNGYTYRIYLCSYDTSLNKSSYVNTTVKYKKSVVEAGTYKVMYYLRGTASGDTLNNYSLDKQKTVNLEKNATLDQIAETYTGFTVADMMINDDTIIVFYNRNQYPITFYNQNGAVISSVSYYYGSYPTVPDESKVFVKGKDFLGWNPAVSTVTSSVTYRPLYSSTATYYEASFVTAYGSAPEPIQIQKKDILTREKLPCGVYENKIISNWVSNTGSAVVNSDMVFTANWVDIPSGVTVPSDVDVYAVSDTSSTSALYKYIVATTKSNGTTDTYPDYYEDYLFVLDAGNYTVQWSDGYRNTNGITIPGNPRDIMIFIAAYTGNTKYSSWLYQVDDGNFDIKIDTAGIYLIRVGGYYQSANGAFHIYKR